MTDFKDYSDKSELVTMCTVKGEVSEIPCERNPKNLKASHGLCYYFRRNSTDRCDWFIDYHGNKENDSN